MPTRYVKYIKHVPQTPVDSTYIYIFGYIDNRYYNYYIAHETATTVVRRGSAVNPVLVYYILLLRITPRRHIHLYST